MTVQATPNFVDVVGDGITTSFPFTFRADDVSWVDVSFLTDLQGVSLNADQDNSPGGNVIYNVAPPNMVAIKIQRITPQTQELDYTRYDPFDSESHEDALDKLTMQVQDLDQTLADFIAQGGGGVIPPIVLEDNEEIQFGTGTDVRQFFNGATLNTIFASAVDWDVTGAADINLRAGMGITLFAPNDTDNTRIVHDGSALTIDGNLVNGVRFLDQVNIRNGNIFRISDAANAESVSFVHDATNLVIGASLSMDGLRMDDMVIYVQERAAATADIVGYGQLWVRNDSPNVLVFTDDTGVDNVLGAGGSPGGANTQIQYNDSNAFGGNAGFTFNDSTLVVDLGGSSSFVELSANSHGRVAVQSEDGGDEPGYFIRNTDSAGGGAVLTLDNVTGRLTLQQMNSAGTLFEDIWVNMQRNGAVQLYFNNVQQFVTSDLGVRLPNTGGTSIYMDEKASNNTTFAGQGQLWVRNDTPNVLVFTNDAGNDFVISTGPIPPIILTDNEEIRFGTGADVIMDFDGTDFNIAFGASADINITGLAGSTNFVQHATGLRSRYEDTTGANHVTVGFISITGFGIDAQDATDSFRFTQFNDVQVLSGANFVIADSTNADTVTFAHDGTDFDVTAVGTTQMSFNGINNYLFNSNATAAGTIWQLSGNVNATLSMAIDNDSNGTGNAARFFVASGDSQWAIFTAGSGNTGTIITGGPTGAQAAIRNLGNYPMTFGTSNTERFQIAGGGNIYFPGAGTTANAANAFLDSGSTPTNELLRSTSSIVYKRDIESIPVDQAIDIVSRLNPIEYSSKASADDPEARFYGLIAEEVAEVDPRLVHYMNGKPDGVMYDRLTVFLIKTMQDMIKSMH